MAPFTQTTEASAVPRFDFDIAGYLRSTVFSSTWKTIFGILLVLINILIIRTTAAVGPVGLSFNLAPNGQPTGLGQLILTLTNGTLITSVVVGLWLIGLLYVAFHAARRTWPPTAQWLKDSMYTGPFGTLVTLALGVLIVFAIRGLLSWAVFGAEFRTDAESVAILRPDTPGAIWGIVGANQKLFAVGRYPDAQVWRIWLSLAIVIALGGVSTFAWSFGAPLKRFQRLITWGWLASAVVIGILLIGFGRGGVLPNVPTNLWGGFMLTMVLSIVGIAVSFPIGIIMALGRRSEVRGVPYLWAFGTGLVLLYWGVFGPPSEATTFNIPVLFRDPPIWTVTLSPITYAVFQAIVIIGIFWMIGHYFGGNMIKTFSILYIELIRGVPLITVLFMANIMLPIFLPSE
ncbi:MAG: hypothetical protein R3264_09910, partial [Anaerolineae bacterium]|nr:hypothetical protein [Anaerolineae bacterium]